SAPLGPAVLAREARTAESGAARDRARRVAFHPCCAGRVGARSAGPTRSVLLALDVAAPPANVVLELARGCLEGVPDGDVHVLVRGVVAVRPADDELAVGHVQIDAHLVQVTLVLMPVRALDGDVARRDVRLEALELRCLGADPRLDRFRMFQTVK